MNEEPDHHDIMVKFGLLMKLIMSSCNSTKDLKAMQYALKGAMDAIGEELEERNKRKNDRSAK